MTIDGKKQHRRWQPILLQTPQRLKQGRKLGGWWFLVLVVLFHAGIDLTDSALSAQSLGYFSDMLQNLLPAFGVMFPLLWLFNLFR